MISDPVIDSSALVKNLEVLVVPESVPTCPLLGGGGMHVIIVACPHLLSCCIILHLFLYFLALSSLHPSLF